MRSRYQRPLDEPLLGDDVEDGNAGRRRQGIRDVGGHVQEALADAVLLDCGGRHGRGQRQAAPQRLRDGDEVGDDAVVLEAEHRPEPPEPRLRLVEDEQHPALGAHLLEAT